MTGREGRPAAGAVSAATLAFGVAALVIAAVLVVLRGVNLPENPVWPALLPLVPIAIMMLVARRRPGFWITVLHLAVGAVSIGLYSSVLIGGSPAALAESPFILALPQLAFIYTIAPTVMGAGNLIAIASAYLVGQGAVLVAAVANDRYPSFDGFTSALTAVILAIGLTDLLSSRRSDADRRAVDRARRDADTERYQREVEAQVVALFHDTVLGELTLLSHRRPGPIEPALEEALRRDLAMIEEGSLWPAAAATAGQDAVIDSIPLPAPVARAIADGRLDGLVIDIAGDLASLQRISAPVGEAVGLALGQVLVNVRQHAGTGKVEIVVDGAAAEVVVMISDAGVGFDSAAVAPGRLGVAHSIVGRIHGVGGRVQLFTSPGSGTAYLFSLPPTPENRWPSGEVSG